MEWLSGDFQALGAGAGGGCTRLLHATGGRGITPQTAPIIDAVICEFHIWLVNFVGYRMKQLLSRVERKFEIFESIRIQMSTNCHFDSLNLVRISNLEFESMHKIVRSVT